ncbi:ABC transporter ATP-binding protein [Streptomyces sp. NBC_00872]|uniref:ABC transporter ATP-binding protein n=1 Tax=Streptomyces sp. NBC_00872 TaxID=2903686 RepID=UPI00386E0D23|nr:ABC transporter ATP-binding protein [Streptomyces sp. NBC_00872]
MTTTHSVHHSEGDAPRDPRAGAHGPAGTAAPAGAHGGATVAIDGLTMRFGERTVSQDIDLTIGAGEVLSIVGPSGCGKTTLLRAVAGLIPPAEGEVRIDGQTTAGTPDGVAMVFQHFGLFPWKTVEANVAYALRVRGVAKKEALERARELITLVGLSGFEKSYPHQLSGGMQQRTGLARALAVRPRLLLMDEPFGALDAQTREVLQFELLNIWQDHPVTMLFVTHSIDEAVLFGDRIAVLNGRPSGVAELIDVALPHPRDRSVLATPEFLAIRERVWSLVMTPDARH